ncbi:hypothetical protein GCM10009642_27850 [Nocardiopsis metallicus]|uniref:Putative transposase n=1 Tax=Nocardiopsis metallicus TaxID=179819 RepID=A0A840WDX8_9ACTN|nr:putative transposase [Nocardiopsis metallicus]
MEIQRGIKYRLCPTPEQAETLDGQGHAARALWNALHDWWTMASQNRRVSLKDADAAIKQARKEIDFLAALPAQAAQQVLKQYHRAWVNCWEGRAEAPRFKSRVRAKMSVDIPQGRDLNITCLSRRWSTVKIPKVGTVRFRAHRAVPGTVTGARLVREANGWHIVLRTHWEQSDPAPHTGPTVGIDRGIAVPLALSDGTNHTHTLWERPKEAERLLRLERKAARQRPTTPGASRSATGSRPPTTRSPPCVPASCDGAPTGSTRPPAPSPTPTALSGWRTSTSPGWSDPRKALSRPRGAVPPRRPG